MTASEIWTILLSSGALAVSLISLGWQIVRSRSDAPRVTLTGWVGYTVLNEDQQDPKWTIQVIVTNAGRLPVTVGDVGWLLDCSGGPTLMRASSEDATPLRLEGHDTRRWEFEVPVRGTLWDGLYGRPSAVIVRQPSWREKRRGIGVQRRLTGPYQRLVIPDFSPLKESPRK